MNISISEIRLSVIWTQTSLSLFSDQGLADAPMKAIGSRTGYATLFDKLQASFESPKDMLSASLGATKPVPSLEVPWPREVGQHFWQFYLDRVPLTSVKGVEAWRNLVPLRAKFPCALEATWLPGYPKPIEFTILPEAFFYPHGVAFVATATCRVKPAADGSNAAPLLTIEDVVDLAFKVRQGKFKTKWNGSLGVFAAAAWGVKPDQEITLDELAMMALSAIRVAAEGPAVASAASEAAIPFTIFTIVRGDGDPAIVVTDEIRRALEAVTKWSATWQYDVLQNLDEMKIDSQNSSPSRVLYGRKRARAAWFPAAFIQQNKPYLLFCYHRNLTLASLQVESLCGVCSKFAEMIRHHTPLANAALNDCARQAAGSLGRLYSGIDKTYRSKSLQVQICQNDYKVDIDEVRKNLMVGPKLQPEC